MFLYLHNQYTSREDITTDTNNRCNRQIELMTTSYVNLMNKREEMYASEVVNLQTHHKREIDEVITFYIGMLEEARAKDE